MSEMKLIDFQRELVIDLDQADECLNEIEEFRPKIITAIAPKRGVGKTTISINLAYTMAAQGKRVLLYDCDYRCNLTAWIFGNNIQVFHGNSATPVEDFIKTIPRDKSIYAESLYDQVMGCESNESEKDEETKEEKKLKPAKALKLSENLYIVVGSRDLSALDEKISAVEHLTSNRLFREVPNEMSARPYHAIMETAKHYKIEYVFLDINSYPGTLNRNLIMSSNYLYVPACLDSDLPELICSMLIDFQRWQELVDIQLIPSTRKQSGKYPWPEHGPKVLGYILSLFSSNKEVAQSEANKNRLIAEFKKVFDNFFLNSLTL